MSKIEGRTLAGILPTLISGLYNDKFDMVREYCQNAYDAILMKYQKKSITNGLIQIDIKNNDLLIHDNGTGMTFDVVEKLATIGYSTKGNFNQVGYRGIGRLSGICGAKKIHFVTKCNNEKYEHLFEINAGELVDYLQKNKKAKITEDAGELLARFSRYEQKKSDSDKSYTIVILYNIYGEAGKITNEDALRKYLECNLPVPVNPKFEFSEKINSLYKHNEPEFPNIKILLNDKQLYKSYNEIDGINHYFETEIINNRGRTLAVCWSACNKSKSGQIKNSHFSGIITKHKGFTLGNSAYVRTILQTAPPQVPEWFAGEIITLDRDLEVSSDRSRFEDNQARTSLNNLLKDKLGTRLEEVARNTSKASSAERKVKQLHEEIEELKDTIRKKNHVSVSYIHEKMNDVGAALKKVKSNQKNIVDNEIKKKAGKTLKLAEQALIAAKKRIEKTDQIEKNKKIPEHVRLVYQVVKRVITKKFDACESDTELLTHIESALLRKFEK
ncbi:MAG: ATP-binding protein [Bacteroidales bacterium]|nr:ATP-binding protein [Bacteroidales bacterium]